MAFLKEKVLPNGTKGEYWRVTHISLTKPGAVIRVVCIVELYVNATHKDTAPLPGTAVSTSFETTMQEAMGNLVALCYIKTKQKNHPALAGALDV